MDDQAETLFLKIMQVCGILKEVLPSAKIECLQRFLESEDELKSEFKEINRLAVLNLGSVKIFREELINAYKQKGLIQEKITVLLKENISNKNMY